MTDTTTPIKASTKASRTRKGANIEARATHYRVRISRTAGGKFWSYSAKFYWPTPDVAGKSKAFDDANAWLVAENKCLREYGRPSAEVTITETVRDVLKLYQEEGLKKFDDNGYRTGGVSTSSNINVLLGTYTDEVTGEELETFKELLDTKAVDFNIDHLLSDDEDSFLSILKEVSFKKDKISSATVRKYVNAISSAFTFAIDHKKTLKIEHPIKGRRNSDKIKNPPHRKITLKDEEFDRMIKHLKAGKQTKKRKEVTAIIQLLIKVACRRSELVYLLKKDVVKHGDGYLITFPKTKNGEARTVPVLPQEAPILESILVKIPKEQERVFTVSPDSVSQAWSRARVKLGGEIKSKNKRLHDLRHTAISYWAGGGKGLPVQDLAKVTGHKDIKTLINIYYNPEPEDIAKTMEKVRKEAEVTK